MKIEIKWPNEQDKDSVVVDVGAREVTCKEVTCGIGIQTEFGYFGIAERDGVIEVLYNGRLVLNSDMIKSAISIDENICNKR